MSWTFNPFTGKFDYYTVPELLVQVRTITKDGTIPSDYSLVVANDFTIPGSYTLTIEGTGVLLII